MVYEARGRWFEELEPGDVYKHTPGRTIGEADNTLFSTLTHATQPLHLDAHFSATSPYGQRLVNGVLTLAVMTGLSVGDLTTGTGVANLSFDEVTFPAPLFLGDTLYAETEILSKRLSRSRSGHGIVQFALRAFNQHGEIVCGARRASLVLCRPAVP
jgi:acyl dehydratase